MERIQAETKLAEWQRLSAKTRAGLEALGLRTVADLLGHHPRRHEDRRQSAAFPCGPGVGPVCLEAVVADMKMARFGRRRSILEIVLAPAGGGDARLAARWFNLPWMRNQFSVGDRLFVFGKVKLHKTKLVLDHPEVETVDDGDTALHAGRIVPVYPLSAGVAQRALRAMVARALDEVDPAGLPSILPPACAAEADALAGGAFPSRLDLLRAYHFPDDRDDLERARRRMALEEFFRLQLAVVWRRRERVATTTVPRCGRGEWLQRLVAALPFPLTEAQKRAIREIRADLKGVHPMHRLLQGDVGSGKTLVATAAIALAVESGCQATVMAPTQILAGQHFRTFRRWLEPLGLRVALRTGGRDDDTHTELEAAAAGTPRPHVVVGTHALLFDKVAGLLEDVGLVVIDEQHKFGVAQRALLQERAARPHVLVMTATPIPRTLAMTVYGDLDISVMDEMPPGRGTVVTGIRVAPAEAEVDAFVRAQLVAGRQAYLVYPLVDESEKQDARAATTGFADWRRRLDGCAVALVTGRTPPDEKDRVMEDFRAGRVQALVSTTVIEVGVDVPDATVMLVHDAERFGLAQLHQLRGRIGRGAHKSYCILLLGKDDVESAARLRILEETRDGFAIAEEDLRLRGPGDVLGTAQSGLPALGRPALELLGDTRLLAGARRLAEQVLASDPMLEHPVHHPLRAVLEAGGGFAHVG